VTASSRPAPIRVLLVEDNAGDARLILELLREAAAHEFDLEQVDRLEPALERLSRVGVDIVLLDLGLPDSQGIETFERARRQVANEPIVVISGTDDEALALDAVRAGAQDYLVKGRIEGELLARVIRHAIERKRAEATLRWLTLAVDQSPAAVFITDPSGAIQYVNHRFTETTGYSAAEVLGKNPRILKSGLTPPSYYQALWRTILAGNTWRSEVQNRRKSGELYWDAVVISPIRNTRGEITHFLAIQEDVTARKLSEEALRGSERRLRTLFETVNLVVLGLDAHGRVDYVNPYLLALTGYAPNEVTGRDWIQTFIPEAQRPRMEGVFHELIERESHSHYQNPIVTKEGAERMISWHNTVVRDERGRATGTLSIGEDITEQRKLEAQLLQAQKMEAVGRLAGGVAHDFNNILTAVFGYLDLVTEELPPESPARDDVSELRTVALRAAGLTRQLLAFSRQQVLQPVVLNLNDVVENLQKMLGRLIGEDVALETVLAGDLSNVRADPGQIEQVILNLAVNARDAMPTGGRLTIETANVTLGEGYVDRHKPAVPGRYVMLAVTDSGTGMDEATMARIFEPFFTTKEKGKGTGLGLATVYGIVKQSGGYIWAYSEVGHGTTFKIYLPEVDQPVEPVGPPREPSERLTGTETILLAEDDDLLRPLARELLAKLGYQVIDARHADEALDLAARHDGPIHLLLSDVVMPGESGLQLARRLHELRPEVRVLYISGYTDDAVVRHGLLDPGLNFLQKPFTPEALARRVRDVLDAP
jgi:PAS domain S-box-containing protein